MTRTKKLQAILQLLTYVKQKTIPFQDFFPQKKVVSLATHQSIANHE